MAGTDEGGESRGGTPPNDAQEPEESPRRDEEAVPDLTEALGKAAAEIFNRKKRGDAAAGDAAAGDKKDAPKPPEVYDVFKRFVESISRAADALQTEAKRRSAAAPTPESTQPDAESAQGAESSESEDAGDAGDAKVIDLEAARAEREEKREASATQQRLGRLVRDAFRGYVGENVAVPDEDGNLNVKLDLPTIKQHVPGLLSTIFGALAEVAAPGSTDGDIPNRPTASGAADSDDSTEPPDSESPTDPPKKVNVQLDLSGLLMDLFKSVKPPTAPPDKPTQE